MWMLWAYLRNRTPGIPAKLNLGNAHRITPCHHLLSIYLCSSLSGGNLATAEDEFLIFNVPVITRGTTCLGSRLLTAHGLCASGSALSIPIQNLGLIKHE